MPCIKLRAPDGTERLIPSGVVHTRVKGEIEVGVVKPCGEDKSDLIPTDPEYNKRLLGTRQLLEELDKEVGGGAGDWIKKFAAPVARLVGKKNCAICEIRRVVTNAYGRLAQEHGKPEAMRIMKELWSMSMASDDGADVVVKLKAYLGLK